MKSRLSDANEAKSDADLTDKQYLLECVHSSGNCGQAFSDSGSFNHFALMEET